MLASPFVLLVLQTSAFSEASHGAPGKATAHFYGEAPVAKGHGPRHAPVAAPGVNCRDHDRVVPDIETVI
jgi:hypothetical protein